MKWYVSITAILFFFSSCNSNNDIPDAVLKPKQMQDIIWDMVKADAYADVLLQKDTINTLPKISMNLTDHVLSLHKTNRSQLENSFKFYSKHPDIFKTILDSINAQQSRRSAPQLVKPGKPGKTLLPK